MKKYNFKDCEIVETNCFPNSFKVVFTKHKNDNSTFLESLDNCKKYINKVITANKIDLCKKCKTDCSCKKCKTDGEFSGRSISDYCVCGWSDNADCQHFSN